MPILNKCGYLNVKLRIDIIIFLDLKEVLKSEIWRLSYKNPNKTRLDL